MQVNDVIWMVMRSDDRVQAGSRGRPQEREQPRQGSVTEVQRDAEPVVLEQESAARSTRFRPGTAATENHHSTLHPCILPAADSPHGRASCAPAATAGSKPSSAAADSERATYGVLARFSALRASFSSCLTNFLYSLGSVGGGGQNTALQGGGGQFSGVHGAAAVGTVGTAKHAASKSSERETSDIRRHAPILVVAPFRCQGISRRCRRAICQAQWRGDRVSAVKNPR